MCGDRCSSSTSCSRWRHETEPGRLDQALSCRLSKVATHPLCFVLGTAAANSAILSTCVTVMLRAISVIQMGFSVDNYMLDPAQVRQCDDFVAPANEPPTSFSESPPTLR